MFSRLASSSSARAVVRRSFASLPPTPPPTAATSRRAVKLGTTFVAGLALGGYLVSSSDLARPVMLDSPVSTPTSTEEPIPSLPSSTESTPSDSSSRIGQGPAVDGSPEADAGPASEFADVDTAGDSVGGSEAGAAKVQDVKGEETEKEIKGGERDPKTMGAFNEETGEINWDCPCLGGMPHGPCGEQFRAAFSCFVYSEQEPKGIECVEKFKDMQECFRAHPDVYGESDYEDEDKDVSVEAEQAQLEPLEKDLKEEPSKPFKGEDDERGELFAQDGGVTGEGIGTQTE